MNGRDLLQLAADAGVPADGELPDHADHLAVEKPFLIADRRDQAAGVHALPFGEHLGQELQRDQQGLQRIVGQLLAAVEQIVQQADVPHR